MSDKKQTWAEVLDGGGEGVPDGEFYGKKFKEGDIVTGGLADRAIKHKWAKRGKGNLPAPKTDEPVAALGNIEDRLAVLEKQELLASLEDRFAALEGRVSELEKIPERAATDTGDSSNNQTSK